MSIPKDDLGDRMKLYESAEAGRRFMPLLPVVCRIDGRCFSAFTHGMKRPYDPKFSSMMIDTTIYLVEETNACMGYTQSDEITLAWHQTDMRSQLWFDGRIHKMVSQLAAQATLCLYRLCVERMPEYAGRLPTFDARAWQVPNRTEATNAFVWREQDAVKNSISMAARTFYSDKQLHGKKGNEMQAMLLAKDVNWNDYPTFFKRGTYVQRKTVTKKFTAEELDGLPPKHEARQNPELEFERHEVREIEMPILSKVSNRNEVIFDGAYPSPHPPSSPCMNSAPSPNTAASSLALAARSTCEA